MNRLPAQPHRSLIDGIRVLQRLAVAREPVMITKLARELGLEPTRAHRLAKTMAHMGFAYQTRERKYSCGPAMHVLAARSMFGSGLIQRALPDLEKLCDYGLTVALGMVWEDQVSYLYHWSPGLARHEGLGRLAVYPAARSSIGIVLLAVRTNEEIRRTFHLPLRPRIPMRRELMADIRRARHQGYGEIVEGRTRSLALSLGDPPYAAVALSGRIRAQDVGRYLDILARTKAGIECRMQPKTSIRRS
ncbi:MAG: helix-turn-helix domain-containing protein [Verrucomicrobiota bacterium]